MTFLQIAVDSNKQSVEVIGELLPSLQQLKLQNSTLQSFRDLGTSLHSLQILWVMRSGISDLDGIGALTGLQELYLQYNDISDLSPLMLHEEIQVIDLEGNCIADIGQIEQLGTLIFVGLNRSYGCLETNEDCDTSFLRAAHDAQPRSQSGVQDRALPPNCRQLSPATEHFGRQADHE